MTSKGPEGLATIGERTMLPASTGFPDYMVPEGKVLARIHHDRKKKKGRSCTIAFHKPYGVLPCFTDSQGRPTLADYVKISGVYAAGRLDRDSEGLMLLTSDGSLAHVVTDPQHKLPKVYLAQVERVPNEDALDRLRKGILLSGKQTRAAGVRLLMDEPELSERPVPIRFRKNVPTAWLEITLREGLNRQVRRMTASVGHPTLRLVRIAIGPVLIGELHPGEWRETTSAEVDRLKRNLEKTRDSVDSVPHG